MRQMSFYLTTRQIRERSKTVTRRIGWNRIKAGDLIQACVKCTGLKPGQKVEKLAVLEVVRVDRERLDAIWTDDVAREGFPGMTREQFIEMFCKHMKGDASQIVNRIEFRYRDDLCMHGITVGNRCDKGCRGEIAGD